MIEPIKKEDIKKAVIEAVEPFTGAIQKDFNCVGERFNRIDERFEKIGTTLIAVVEDLKEARKERQELKTRIGVDLF